MKKINSHVHWEVVKINKAAISYVMKEDTRLEGPFEFGERPKVNQQKDSVEKARLARAELNQRIHEAGPLESLQTGLINYKDYIHVRRARDMINLDQQ